MTAIGCGQGNTSSDNQCVIAGFNPTPTTGSELGIGYQTLGGRSVAQPFVANSVSPPKAAVAYLKRQGEFTSNSHTLTATIEADSGGIPNSVPVVTSTPLDVSTISETGTYYSFSFNSNVTLVKDQTYWLRIKTSYAVSNANYISWLAYDGKQGGYELPTTNSFTDALIGIYRFLLFTVKC
jgi:hypothetical protein